MERTENQNQPEKPQQRVVMSRLVRRDQQDRAFDLAFWQKIEPAKRFAAAWQMVKEVSRIRGKNGEQPRLQRSVSVLKRRGS